MNKADLVKEMSNVLGSIWDWQVTHNLAKGIAFSLPHPISSPQSSHTP